MTASELIEFLSNIPGNTPIFLEPPCGVNDPLDAGRITITDSAVKIDACYL